MRPLIISLAKLVAKTFVAFGLIVLPFIFALFYGVPLDQNFFGEAIEFPLLMSIPLSVLFAIGYYLIARSVAVTSWDFWLGFL